MGWIILHIQFTTVSIHSVRALLDRQATFLLKMKEGNKLKTEEAEKTRKLGWAQILIGLLIIALLVIQLFIL